MAVTSVNCDKHGTQYGPECTYCVCEEVRSEINQYRAMTDSLQKELVIRHEKINTLLAKNKSSEEDIQVLTARIAKLESELK